VVFFFFEGFFHFPENPKLPFPYLGALLWQLLKTVLFFSPLSSQRMFLPKKPLGPPVFEVLVCSFSLGPNTPGWGGHWLGVFGFLCGGLFFSPPMFFGGSRDSGNCPSLRILLLFPILWVLFFKTGSGQRVSSFFPLCVPPTTLWCTRRRDPPNPAFGPHFNAFFVHHTNHRVF